MPSSHYKQSPIGGLFVILFGSMLVFFPAHAWFLSYGWRYKDVNPSEVALVIHRFSGVIAIIIGIMIIAK
ncbi:MAG TPA: hypothetical protein DCS67_05430 [Clostridiales bacterium UBA8960]|nr:hypothetical protein [Clostridiales bacterium UBA8960]